MPVITGSNPGEIRGLGAGIYHQDRGMPIAPIPSGWKPRRAAVRPARGLGETSLVCKSREHEAPDMSVETSYANGESRTRRASGEENST